MHILLAVDGSSGALNAVHTVRARFGAGTRITLLHVLSRYTPSRSPLPDTLLGALRDEEDSSAHTILSETRALLEGNGFELTDHIAEGHPAQEITRVASELKTDLIMMGALGLTGWMRALLGSISLTVVKHAPCPVWVVKHPPETRPLQLLLATDGSPDARHALLFLGDLPFAADAHLNLLHVVPSINEQLQLSGGPLDPPVLTPLYELGDHFHLRGKHLLKEDMETASKRFAQVHTATAEGDPRRHILDHAKTMEADLIVMGSKGLSGIREFFLGSVSHNVLKHAHTSVMIVMAEE
ncbi:MAG: universal stress protein [Leptospirillia bacterium]